MSEFEAVDRLIFVTDYAEFAVGTEKFNHLLLGTVQVLILVYQYVRKFAAFLGKRIRKTR